MGLHCDHIFFALLVSIVSGALFLTSINCDISLGENENSLGAPTLLFALASAALQSEHITVLSYADRANAVLTMKRLDKGQR